MLHARRFFASPIARAALLCALASPAIGQTIDSFESAAEVSAWSASRWASATLDDAGAPAALSAGSFGATDGAAALAMPLRFLGRGYEQGFVGRAARASFGGCASISLDVTLPTGAPSGLAAQIILFLGPAARWTGPAARTALRPGATTTVTLPLAGALDPAPLRAEIADVRGYGLKIDGSGVAWRGTVAIDAVRLAALDPPAPEDLAVRPVGFFGGFVRSGRADIPGRNGTPTRAGRTARRTTRSTRSITGRSSRPPTSSPARSSSMTIRRRFSRSTDRRRGPRARSSGTRCSASRSPGRSSSRSSGRRHRSSRRRSRARVTAARYDAARDAVVVTLAPHVSGPAVVRVRWAGKAFRDVPVTLRAGRSATVTIRPR